MFFENNKVNDILICTICEGRLENPKILPCGETICSFCVTSLKIVDKMFKCLVCKKKHEMPIDGLLKNILVLKMLSIKPNEISRGKAFETFQDSLNNIQKNINLITNGVNRRDDCIKEHFSELRNEVQLYTEETIQQLNNSNIQIIKEIDGYEKEQLRMSKEMKNLNSSFKEYNDFLKEMKSFYDKNISYFNENLVKDSVFEELNKTAINMNNLAEVKIKNLKCINLGGRTMRFFPKFNNKIILGETSVIDTRIVSTILNSKSDNQIEETLVFFDQNTFLNAARLVRNKNQDLISLCGFPVSQTWILIYRASQDGFEASSFHAKCDDQPNTLTVIKSTNDNVFGGYTEQSWSGIGIYKADPNSFIFSLINKLNKPLKIKWSQNYGICCNISYGPIFGGGNDLLIADKSNTNTNSYSNLSHSYTHPEYEHGSNEAKLFLAGSLNFQVSEIEVYTKQ